MPERNVDAVVVGGGMAGLAAADALAASGISVAVIEAAPDVGGLARATVVGGEPIEPYYHHVFPQDRETLELIARLGLSGRLEWLPASMGILHRGRVLAFDSPLDLLRFSAVSPLDRVRMGAATAYQLVRRDRERLDAVSVGRDGPHWFGRRGYAVLWEPLLTAKFGPYADRVAMAWLVARIRQRAGGRRATGDRLGYLRGSLGTLAAALAADLDGRGVAIMTGTRVGSIVPSDGGFVVSVDGDTEGTIRSRAVVACTSGGILGSVVHLPPAYARAMAAIPHRGIACVLVEMDRPLSPYYWINVTDRLGMGCVAIIEHTNLVDPERYGGRSLLYLAHYVGEGDPAWTASAEDLVRAAVPGIRAVNPRFDEGWITGLHLARDRFAQPVPLVGGPMPSLTVETGIPGLLHASLAHVYPDDRGVSKAIGAGRRAAAGALAHLATAGAPRP